jgi:hypothetical protein
VLKLGKFSPIAKFSRIADRNRPLTRRSSSIERSDENRRASRHHLREKRKKRFDHDRDEGKPERQI